MRPVINTGVFAVNLMYEKMCVESIHTALTTSLSRLLEQLLLVLLNGLVWHVPPLFSPLHYLWPFSFGFCCSWLLHTKNISASGHRNSWKQNHFHLRSQRVIENSTRFLYQTFFLGTSKEAFHHRLQWFFGNKVHRLKWGRYWATVDRQVTKPLQVSRSAAIWEGKDSWVSREDRRREKLEFRVGSDRSCQY